VLTQRHRELVDAASAVERAVTDLYVKLAAVVVEPRANAKKLTLGEVSRIRGLWRTLSMSQRAIADAFDVNPATISRTVRGVYHLVKG
jgi:DNA-binding MarR family transcriptional regulator